MGRRGVGWDGAGVEATERRLGPWGGRKRMELEGGRGSGQEFHIKEETRANLITRVTCAEKTERGEGTAVGSSVFFWKGGREKVGEKLLNGGCVWLGNKGG